MVIYGRNCLYFFHILFYLSYNLVEIKKKNLTYCRKDLLVILRFSTLKRLKCKMVTAKTVQRMLCYPCNLTTVSPSTPPQPPRLRILPITGAYCCRTQIRRSSHSLVINMEAKKPEESAFTFLTKKTYQTPAWASHLSPVPSHVYSLGHVRKL